MCLVARRPRLPGGGIPHHITKRGHNRDEICRSIGDFIKFRQFMQEGCEEHELRVHAYVIMNNHFHLLATPATETALRCAVKWIAGAYTQWFNFKYRRTGTLWEGRYWASHVDSDQYFLNCSGYIELNPVRAGIVAQPGDYPWSSYRRNAADAPDGLITQHEVYLRLGPTERERTAAYQHLLVAGVQSDVVSFIRDATRSSTAINGLAFEEWHVDSKGECAK